MKRKKLPSLPKLKKKLWKIFSEYIRRRDADKDGMVKCIACPRILHWKEMHAGHYYAKSLGLAVYFDEVNVQAECPACNLFKHGNLAPYAIALRKKYGPDVLEELERLKNSFVKYSRSDYEELIQKYQEKLNDR